eukprot:CAMPEP_0114540774 /NCGR_PEP_ID=MMETSP0114-20121206/953_1 /TAXON_ID=31324 /ORGANISM="Goniomonas sp, Strain m" /LENGTH=758 /DNA_ID=CAMNT_0001724971 /DNA_START=397 /DNA_END=2670 /DNA_ORIENTATION=-
MLIGGVWTFFLHCVVTQQFGGMFLFTLIVVMGLSLMFRRTISETKRAAVTGREDALDEKANADALILDVLPPSVAQRLKKGETDVAEAFDSVTILFCNVTNLFEVTSSPAEHFQKISEIFLVFEQICNSVQGAYKVENVRESFVAVGGAPIRQKGHEVFMTELAMELVEAAVDHGLDVQIGLHTGCITAGVVGKTLLRYSFFGDSINTASRMMSSGQTNRVQVSHTTAAALQEANGMLRCSERGVVAVKGKGNMLTFWVSKAARPVPPSMPGVYGKAIPRLLTRQSSRQLRIATVAQPSALKLVERELEDWEVWVTRGERTHMGFFTQTFNRNEDVEEEYRARFGQVAIGSNRVPALILAAIYAILVSISVAAYVQAPETERDVRKTALIFDAIILGVLALYCCGLLFVRVWWLYRACYLAFSYSFTITLAVGYLIFFSAYYEELHGLDPVDPWNQFATGIEAAVLSQCFFYLLGHSVGVAANLGHTVIHSIAVLIMFSFDLPDKGLLCMRLVFMIVPSFMGASIGYIVARNSRLQFLFHQETQEEKRRSENLLYSLLPAHVVPVMLTDDEPQVDAPPSVTVLQMDIVSFTTICQSLQPGQTCALLNELFTHLDELLPTHNVRKMYTVGDAYIVASGFPDTCQNHTEAVCSFALDALQVLDQVNDLNEAKGLPRVTMRAGICTGEATAGVVGFSKPAYLMWGSAVTGAEMLEQLAKPGRILISEATAEGPTASVFDCAKGPLTSSGARAWHLKGRLLQ